MTPLAQLHSDWREAERRWGNTPRDHLMRSVRHAIADRALDALRDEALRLGWDRSQGAVLSWVAQRINETEQESAA